MKNFLKSAELTGIWEKKLRDIEHQKYDPASFIEELKEQMNQIVQQVLSVTLIRRVCVTTKEDLKKRIVQKSKAKATQKGKRC